MNPILRFSKKHYLKKLSQGKSSKDYVARLYLTSTDNVENALKKYREGKKPFKETDISTKQGRMNIAISIISSVLVLFTLFEMQAERNLAYMPNVFINSSGVKFSWDQNHDVLSNSVELSEEERHALEAMDYTEGRNVKLAIQNTGVGNATEIYIDWLYEENIKAFQELFSKTDDIDVSIDNNLLALNLPNISIGTPIRRNKQYIYGFLTSDPNQKEEITIPDSYVYLYEMGYAYLLQDSLPHVRFLLEYKDIQGKTYSKTFTIKPTPDMVVIHPEGYGFGSVRFLVTEERQSSSHLIILIIAGLIALLIFVCFIDWVIKIHKARTQEKRC